MRFGFLGTRVGRRFLVVNLLTALIPVAIITAVSFAFVRSELREQSEAHVSQLSKSVTMTALGDLAAGAVALATPRDSAAPDPRFVATGHADAARTHSVGVASLTALTSDQREHLRSGRPLLMLAPTRSGTALTIVRPDGPQSASSQPVRWGRLRIDEVFADVNDAVVGDGATVCIYETQSLQRIHCSDDATPAAETIARERARQGGADRAATRRGDFIVSAREIYLRPAYAAREWIAVVMRPADVTFAGAANFRNTFLLLMGAVIALIFSVSHAQIRRTTEPLERLEKATHRLKAGDFGTPVVVTSDDEFAQVADSFNGMASSLHRQLSLMRTLDAVDQSALGARDTSAVVGETLVTIATALGADQVTLAIIDPSQPSRMTVNTRVTHTTVRRDVVRSLPAHERDELLHNPRYLLLRDADGARAYRDDETSGAALVLPLIKDDELLGVVCVNTSAQTDIHDDACTEARRIADRVALALSNVQLLNRLDALSTGTVLAFARAIDANSPWTAGHSERVTRVALEIGRQMQLSESDLDTLQRGGLLHDIGKIAVPPAVLDKAGKLTGDEWEVMRRHPIVGCEILSPIPAFADALPIVRSHHERMDGTGYPDQLHGEEIPFLARVMAVADVFDALASDRPYRAGMSTADVCDIIQSGSGTHFDPRVVHALLDAVHAGRINATLPTGASAVLAATVARARGPVAQPA